nr:MAG TPA: PrgU-like protein [Caudoviricetes sp.]
MLKALGQRSSYRFDWLSNNQLPVFYILWLLRGDIIDE